ncbi:hypothetical protein FNX44_021425 [Streptomyces sp. OF1]|nr:hypothetical protein [Streptomyces alkaliterrae]
MTSILMATAIAVVGTLLDSGLMALVTARIERRKNEALEGQQVRQRLRKTALRFANTGRTPGCLATGTTDAGALRPAPL